MKPAEQSALQGLVESELSAEELLALEPLVEARNDVGIATLLSAGRTRLVPRLITARGVRGALTVPQASRFLALLKDAAGATDLPAWLDVALRMIGVPAEDHPAYLDMFACAHEWLQGNGLDLGDPTTRAGLDIIAASDPAKFGATVAILKAMAVVDDPIPFDHVSRALNKAQGLMTL
jgi:hypothetical protein